MVAQGKVPTLGLLLEAICLCWLKMWWVMVSYGSGNLCQTVCFGETSIKGQVDLYIKYIVLLSNRLSPL